MGQNVLVQNLGKTKLNNYVDILVEDNIGEGIHIHFRVKNSVDIRLTFSVQEFLSFSELIEQAASFIGSKDKSEEDR